MSGERWRMVNYQDGVRTVSSVVLSEEEAREGIEVEWLLHDASGWTTIIREPDRLLVQRKRSRDGRLVKREIVVERFAPETDTDVTT